MLIIKKSPDRNRKSMSINCLSDIPFRIGKIFIYMYIYACVYVCVYINLSDGKRIDQKLWPYVEGDNK